MTFTSDPVHYVRPSGTFTDERTACGLDEDAVDLFTFRLELVTCPKCLECLKKRLS